MWNSIGVGVARLLRPLISAGYFPLLHEFLSHPKIFPPVKRRGSIEGTLYIDGAPAPKGTPIGCANSQVDSAPMGSDLCGENHFSAIMWNDYVRTDAKGHFRFKRIPAGEVQVGRAYPLRTTRKNRPFGMDIDEEMPMDHDVYLVVSPGETVQVNLGIAGRRVQGQLTLPNAIALPDTMHVELGLLRAIPQEPAPPTGLSDEDREGWSAAFFDSTEGLAWRAACQRMYHVQITPEGHFTINNVQPGDYWLEIQLNREDSDTTRTSVPLGDYKGTLKIDAEDGVTGEPLDLGEIRLTPYASPTVGDILPDIKGVRNSEGLPMDWSAHSGRGMLLFLFFAHDDRNEDFLRAIHQAQTLPDTTLPGSSFVLCKEDEIYIARTLAKHAGARLTWGYVPEANSAAWSAAFGVRRSAAFLVGPDGRLVACDLNPADVADRVRDTLLPSIAS